MPIAVQLGYVDVYTNITAGSPGGPRTFPLITMVLGSGEPHPGFFAIVGLNSYEVLTPGDLSGGAAIVRNDDSGQEIHLFMIPGAGLVDAAYSVRLNSTALTSQIDYAAHPSPARGESFLVMGASSVGGSATPTLGAVLATHRSADVVRPRDRIHIEVLTHLSRPHELSVGQLRQRTAVATFSSPDGDGEEYRRAVDGEIDGLLVALTAEDPTTDGISAVHIDLLQPRTGDGPVRPVAPAEVGGAGAIPTSGARQYRTTWVQQNGNETSATPPSAPVTTGTGRIRVPLPVWVDPVAPGLLGPVVPDPVVGRRVYRTVTSESGEAGEFFLVAEIDDNLAAEWIDNEPDDALDEPLLTSLELEVQHIGDVQAGTQGPGFARLRGSVLQQSYEEAADGTPAFRGSHYDADLHAVPPHAMVAFTTRPTGGRPRVRWHSAVGATPAGVGEAGVRVTPTGAAAGLDSHIDAELAGVPPDFGVDWLTWGDGILRLEVGHPDDVSAPFEQPLALAQVRAAPVGLGPARLPTASPRALWGELIEDDGLTWVSIRGLARFRLLTGQPHPDDPRHAVLGDGVVVDLQLDRRAELRSRSARLLRLARGSANRVVLRTGALPDELAIDVRPGDDATPTSARVRGRLRRLTLLYQDAAQLAVEDVSSGRRRDGLWVAVPDTGAEIEGTVGADSFEGVLSDRVRIDASLRSAAGLGSDDFRVHLAQASVTARGAVAVELPDAGATKVDVAAGASGRVALSTRPPEADVHDHLVGLRATPQLKVRLRQVGTGADGERVLDEAGARWVGASGFTLPAAGDDAPFLVSLRADRANTAFRGHARLTDERMQEEPWDMVKARVEDVPEQISLLARTDIDRYVLRTDRRAGRVVVMAEPPVVATDGPLAGTFLGVGLARAELDSLPTEVQLDLLGGANDLQAAPFNSDPPDDWRRSGFRIDGDGELVARGLRLTTVAFARPETLTPTLSGDTVVLVPVAPTAFWSTTAASLIKIASDDGRPGPVWIWTPSEPLPGPGALAGEWEDLEAWLGYRIEDPALVTLQLQSYVDATAIGPRFWRDPGMSWTLEAELQMEDYRGEVTVDGDLSPAGDEDAGPGKWYLRSPDGGPLNSQIVFGNTGGWISSRPRIFAPFPLA